MFTIDNRRLLAFNAAGIEKIPVEIVSLENPAVAYKLANRFDPILGKGDVAIVVNKSMRNEALDLLNELNMIRGIHRGY